MKPASNYLLAPPSSVGTRGVTGHLPLPVLVLVVLPDASRRVPVTKPDPPFIVWLPADCSEAEFIRRENVVAIQSLPAYRQPRTCPDNTEHQFIGVGHGATEVLATPQRI